MRGNGEESSEARQSVDKVISLGNRAHRHLITAAGKAGKIPSEHLDRAYSLYHAANISHRLAHFTGNYIFFDRSYHEGVDAGELFAENNMYGIAARSYEFAGKILIMWYKKLDSEGKKCSPELIMKWMKAKVKAAELYLQKEDADDEINVKQQKAAMFCYLSASEAAQVLYSETNNCRNQLDFLKLCGKYSYEAGKLRLRNNSLQAAEDFRNAGDAYFRAYTLSETLNQVKKPNGSNKPNKDALDAIDAYSQAFKILDIQKDTRFE